MSVLPRDTFLGKLQLVEVYEYYDQPVLFACRNAAEMYYLVVQIDAWAGAAVWLYVALSSSRFEAVRQGDIDLYSAFNDAEDEIVYEVTLFDTPHPAQIRVLPAGSLNTQQLPEKGERLDRIISDDTRSISG